MHTRTNCIDYIEFPVPNPETLKNAKAFYETVFGWQYKDWGDDYSDTQSSGLGSGLNADPEHRPDRPLAVIYCDDLEQIRAQVISGKAKISKDIFSFPGGRRFQFIDPAGNELAVWSDK